MKVRAGMIAAFSVFSLIAAPGHAAESAQSFPSKPIRIIVPYSPGGTTDLLARSVGKYLTEAWKQPVVVENKPGANGMLGADAVAKAPADGYTLGVGAAGALSANSSLYAQMPFDALKDFKPVTGLAAIPFVIIGNPSVPAHTMKDLLALAKAQPGKLSIAHGGNGTAMHLSAALFSQMADVKMVEVPYKGSGPAALGVLAGNVPLAVVDLPSALQQIKAGKLIAYAVTSPQRLPQLPDVPTVAEAGLPGYESIGWFGVVAPAGTPQAIVNRLNAEITGALNDEKIKATMRGLGVEPMPMKPEVFDAYIRSETQKWAKVIHDANIKLD
jgi:tripartite-type tricarboxylate transporter receptor subunit TctC